MPNSRSHPSAHLPVPADVDDILLWRLSIDVAAAHEQGPRGRCTSLLCASAPNYPCPTAIAAQRAAHAARRRTAVARGRAVVPPAPVTAQTAVISAAAVVRQPVSTAPYQRTTWPPPLRRPNVWQAA